MTEENIIIKRVISVFGITLSQLHTGDKSRKYFYCRCALANLLRAAGYSLHQIGEIVNRNHSTIAYYMRVHGILMGQVDSYRENFIKCKNELKIEENDKRCL